VCSLFQLLQLTVSVHWAPCFRVVSLHIDHRHIWPNIVIVVIFIIYNIWIPAKWATSLTCRFGWTSKKGRLSLNCVFSWRGCFHGAYTRNKLIIVTTPLDVATHKSVIHDHLIQEQAIYHMREYGMDGGNNHSYRPYAVIHNLAIDCLPPLWVAIGSALWNRGHTST
jgi:hypothetical protein